MARGMFRMAVAVATLAVASQGIEVIENYYRGERYEPEGRSIEELFPYSSSHIASAASSSSPDGEPLGAPRGRMMPEEGSRDTPFASLMRQLGTALHRTLAKNHLRPTLTRDGSRNLDSQPQQEKVQFLTLSLSLSQGCPHDVLAVLTYICFLPSMDTNYI